MRQKTIVKKLNENKIPKKLNNNKIQTYVLYFVIKDNVSFNNAKTIAMLTRSKDERIKKLKLQIDDFTDDKKHKHTIVSVMMDCTSQQYIIYKYHLEKLLSKNLLGKVESTQKDVFKYAI